MSKHGSPLWTLGKRETFWFTSWISGLAQTAYDMTGIGFFGMEEALTAYLLCIDGDLENPVVY